MTIINITIIIEGKTGIGKSTIGRIIYDALMDVVPETREIIDLPNPDISKINEYTFCVIKKKKKE